MGWKNLTSERRKCPYLGRVRTVLSVSALSGKNEQRSCWSFKLCPFNSRTAARASLKIRFKYRLKDMNWPGVSGKQHWQKQFQIQWRLVRMNQRDQILREENQDLPNELSRGCFWFVFFEFWTFLALERELKIVKSCQRDTWMFNRDFFAVYLESW